MINIVWFIPVAISCVIFTNHYNRDAVGALEKQLEADVPISVVQYAFLNTIYFTPNILSPLCAGLVIKPLGGPARVFVYFTFAAAIGNILFAIGVQLSSISVMCLGRFISGVMYESIDTLPVILLRPIFEHRRWNLVVGMMNASLRLGSVLNFYVSPLSYGIFGLQGAFWIAALVAVLGVVAAICNLVILSALDEKDLGTLSKETNGNNIDTSSSKGSDVNGNLEMTTTNRQISNVSTSNEASVKASTSLVSILVHIVDHVKETVPFNKFSWSFYFYFLTVSCVYGAMVPFWFLGSKFLQDKYGMNVEIADALILLPEGCIVIISPLLGIAMDHFKPTVIPKLLFLAVSSFCVPLCYVLLIIGYRQTDQSTTHSSLPTDDTGTHSDGDDGRMDDFPTYSYSYYYDDGNLSQSPQIEWVINPVSVMVFLGVSYACTNCMVWSCITHMLPTEYFDINSILVSCGMNILPSILPPLSVSLYFRTHNIFGPDDAIRSLTLLIIAGVLSSFCSILSILTVPYDTDLDKPRNQITVNDLQYNPLSSSSSHGSVVGSGLGSLDDDDQIRNPYSNNDMRQPKFVISDGRDEEDVDEDEGNKGFEDDV